MPEIDPTPPSLKVTPTPEPAPNKSDASYIFMGREGLRAGWGLAIFAVIVVLLTVTAAFLIAKARHRPFPPQKPAATAAKATPDAPELMKPKTAILNEVSQFAVLFLATWIMSRIERRRNAIYGLGGKRRIPQFLQGLLVGVLCLSLLVGLLRAQHLLVFDQQLLHGKDIVQWSLVWLFCFIFVGLFEEYLFRGYMQHTLARGLAGLYGSIAPNSPHRKTFGFWAAALLLSLLFGAAHGSNPGESPFGLVSVVLAGIFFSLALWRTGSLWWAIGFHASWDWAQSFLYGVADSGYMIQYRLFATHPVGKPILSGGATGPEGSVYLMLALAVGAAAIVFTLPKQDRDAA